jgi:hypothetical protein
MSAAPVMAPDSPEPTGRMKLPAETPVGANPEPAMRASCVRVLRICHAWPLGATRDAAETSTTDEEQLLLFTSPQAMCLVSP